MIFAGNKDVGSWRGRMYKGIQKARISKEGSRKPLLMEEERWGQRTNHKRDNPANHKRRRRRQPRAPEGEGEGEGSGREGEGERGRGRRRRRWRQRERGRGNAVVARTPTSNMSVKEGGESVREASERRKFTILISINNRRRRKFSRQLCG